MKLGSVPLEQACGKILAHNVVSEGKRVLRKGSTVDARAIALLRELGQATVAVAELEPDDIAEDPAALMLGQALVQTASGLNYRVKPGGRITLFSLERGVLRVDTERLLSLNRITGVTLATLPDRTLMVCDQALATLKIIPFALPGRDVERALELLRGQSLLQVLPLQHLSIAIAVAGSPGSRQSLFPPYQESIARRLSALDRSAAAARFIELGAEPVTALALEIQNFSESGTELLLLASETATLHPEDLIPSAITQAGGQLLALGAPVFPGNLIVVGQLGRTVIVGLPGCVRGRGLNIIDLLLPRLLSGEVITAEAIARLGLGGFLLDNSAGED
jgi:molybdenum cofactor cytidylyltransferase